MNFLFSLIIVLTIIASPLKALSDEVVLAGGCFWCLEHDLEYLEGIKSVESGYSGGDLDNPTYNNHVGHQEVVLVNFDPQLVTLDKILRLYLRNIDPLDGKGQFCDRGDSYRPVIFFEDSIGENKSHDALISASKELNTNLQNIEVEIKPRSKFWIAEDYHQDFAINNELKYKFYRFSCGRDKRLEQLWGINSMTTNTWSE
tara:strand:+ start:1763 stop:2365 length:603 start_codon:yes stop_codon:yes gene_type:complete